MKDEIARSIEDVQRAIIKLNQAFERHGEELKEKGNHEAFNQWIQAKAAMRDSGAIYLSWARHYAKSSREEDDMREDDLFEFSPQ